MKNTWVASLFTIAIVTPIGPTPPGGQTTPACERLTATVLSATRVTLAETVAPGSFIMPTIAGQAAPPANAFADLPAFCRAAATLTRSADSNIKIEVWLPTKGWNGKLLAVGNGEGATRVGARAQ